MKKNTKKPRAKSSKSIPFQMQILSENITLNAEFRNVGEDSDDAGSFASMIRRIASSLNGATAPTPEASGLEMLTYELGKSLDQEQTAALLNLFTPEQATIFMEMMTIATKMGSEAEATGPTPDLDAIKRTISVADAILLQSIISLAKEKLAHIA